MSSQNFELSYSCMYAQCIEKESIFYLSLLEFYLKTKSYQMTYNQADVHGIVPCGRLKVKSRVRSF